MRVRMIPLALMVCLLLAGGGAAAQADCLALCTPTTEPTPAPQPNPQPAPAPAPAPAPVPAPQPSPQPQPGEVVYPAGAARLLTLVNQSRSDRGLPPVSARGDVAGIAVDHSTAMAKAGDIWHNDAYFTPETKRRLNARTVGENVAVNASIDDAHARLMNSPGHRANILNPAFTVIGIGVVQQDGGSFYITEDFVEPLPAAAPAPAPAARRAAPAKPAGATTTVAPAAPPAPATTAAPVVTSTTAARDHLANGVTSASTSSVPATLQAGTAPTDATSALTLAALAMLSLTGATAARWLRRRTVAALTER